MNKFLLLSEISGDDAAAKRLQFYLKKLVDNSIGWLIGIGVILAVLWGMYIGVKFLSAQKAEQRIEAKKLLRQFIIGVVLIFVLAVGAPLLIQALASWFSQSSNK